MQALPTGRYRFDNFELDLVRRRLLRDGRSVSLSPKAFDMLRVLVEHNGRLVTKEDLFSLVWEDQIVEESNLTVNMSAIRRALGETATDPRYITTVSGRGYYFTADLKSDEDDVLIVESQTISRVVVEDESYVDDLDEAVPVLPPATKGVNWISKLLPLAAGALLLAVVGGVALWFFVLRPNKTSMPFTKVSIKRLTSSGRVNVATISPDGKLFAYSEEGPDGRATLQLEHVDGSGRVILRPSQFVNYQSITFTPDGGRIYYGMTADDATENGLYRVPCFGGAPEKIKDSYAGRIAFSPNGREFAFLRNDSEKQTSSILVTDELGKTEREVATRPRNLPFISTTLDWSPDGGRLAIAAVSDTKTQNQEIFVIDVSTGALTQLTKADWDGIRAIAWLDKGRGMIATAGDQDIAADAKLWYVSESDGKAQPLIADLNAYGIIARLSNDKKVLLTVQGQYISNVWIAPADNLAAAKQITHDMIGGVNGWMGVEWLPDARVLYTSRNKKETIWVMNSNGENQRQIIPDGGRNYNVSASADGKLMAFDSDRGGTDEVWISKVDGGEIRQLTSGGGNSQPHISPDGKWVLFFSARNGIGCLWRVSTESGEPATQITNIPSSWARYSPDGRRIAANCAVDGKSKLCIFSAEGGDPISHFDAPPRANFRLGTHWVPDGSAVTYRDWFSGIWRQDLKGGPPVRLQGLPNEKLYAYAWSADGKQFAYSRGWAIQDIILITDEE